MIASVINWSLRRLVEVLVLRRRSDDEKAVDVLVLRHELMGFVGRSPGRVACSLTESCSAL
jgi:hypothetical protein